MSETELIHATTVAIGGRGVLIAGPPGSGKSDLALRLIDRGAVLIADDQTEVRREVDAVLASAPSTIAGRMEVRGVGIADLSFVGDVPVALAVTLSNAIDRLPHPATRIVAGVPIPHLLIDPRPASAPIKVELALAQACPVIA